MTASEVAPVDIPAFVVRGAARWSENFGQVQWRTEADLRDALAAAWWFHGAGVRTEVKVPDCGRIDILVRVGHHELIVEVKRRVTTSTEARQAFQQAHAYMAFLDSADDDLDDAGDLRTFRCAHVVAADLDADATRRASSAYEYVDAFSYGAAMHMPSYLYSDMASALAEVASARQRILGTLTAFSRWAEVTVGHRAERADLVSIGAIA